MKVGVLGSGDVAKVLGTGFLKHSHDVMMGTRAPAKLADWAVLAVSPTRQSSQSWSFWRSRAQQRRMRCTALAQQIWRESASSTRRIQLRTDRLQTAY